LDGWPGERRLQTIDMENISVNITDFKELKKKYLKAKKDKEETFIWKDREILVSFAKYLIEYIESEFKKIIESQ
jgi:hypothetical protein